MDISRNAPQDFPRTAIVTGSDSGIGKATAVALAGLGCDVGITWHTDEQGAKRLPMRCGRPGGAPRCGSSISLRSPAQ